LKNSEKIPSPDISLIARKANYVKYCASCGSVLLNPIVYWSGGVDCVRTPARLILVCDRVCRQLMANEYGSAFVLASKIHEQARDWYRRGPAEVPELFSNEPLPPQPLMQFATQHTGSRHFRRRKDGNHNRTASRRTPAGSRR